MIPERLRLSRARGFRLDDVSMARNGLAVVNVARPSRWGNPFHLREIAKRFGLAAPDAQAKAVALYAEWLRQGEPGPKGSGPPTVEDIHTHLRGKNLACWCAPGTPCHADILLEVANR